MNILGMDSSGLVASAAVWSDDTILAEFTVNNKQTHSQTLLPMIDQVVTMSGKAIEDIDAIAVAAGPGSFTGLRIGSATAKGISLALKKPVIPVPTLEGMAYRVSISNGIICPMMDARRNQVYTGIYAMENGRLTVLKEQEAVDIHELIDQLKEILQAEKYKDREVIFLGDGVPVQEAVLEKECTFSYQKAPAHLNRQSAAAVASLGAVYFAEGKAVEGKDHTPVYLRQSQAERERAMREKEK